MGAGSGDLVVTALVPAWNEEARIGNTVRAIRDIPGVSNVIVIDDCSNDMTISEAKAAGATVERLPFHQGKGGALREGIRRLSPQTDIVMFLDADLEESARFAQDLLIPVLAGEADMSIAQFARTGPAGFGIVRGLARWGIHRLTGWLPESPLSGQRVMRRAVLRSLSLASGWGVEVGLTVDALRKGFRLIEVPVDFKHRATGRDWRGFVHRGRQFAGVAAALACRWSGGPKKC